ncbi:MAG: hypothetical protein Q4C96_00215 [Planctomycetia bacterium]|nr:hypothetical protein [Planctomycetia bacterium]
MTLSIPPQAIILKHNLDQDAHENLERKTQYASDSTSSTVTVTLTDNSIQNYETALESLTISISGDFNYGGLNFISGNNPTVLSSPDSWIFNGDDCTPERIFIPTANSCYRLAVEKTGQTVFCDVQKSHVTSTYIA